MNTYCSVFFNFFVPWMGVSSYVGEVGGGCLIY